MTNTKTTKKALLFSCLSMLLCISMLVGSTYAWFTDTATTGVNTIVAGNLDIKLSYMNANDTDYAEISTKTTDLFVNKDGSAMLWEPGAVSVCYFKLENLGTLALQYKMKVAYKDTVTYMGQNGEIKLSNALKSAIVELNEGEKLDRDAVATALADVNAVKALGFQDAEGIKMESGATRYFAIVITMPTEIGNDYNIPTGEPSLQIQLGIELVATQITAESDSFDDQYDKDATFTVATPDSLAGAITDSKDGDTIVLAQDIVLNEQVQIADGKEVTIDLAGNKLDLGGVGENGAVGDGITVENGATLNLVNTGADKTTIEYLGESTGYDAIYVDGGELNIGGNVELVVSPKANSAIHAEGKGTVVNISEGMEINVAGVTDNQFAAIYVSNGATVNMTGGTISVSNDLTENDGWNNDVVGVMLLGDHTEFNMTGGTINVHGKGAFTQAVQIATMNGSANPATMNISGGTFNVTKDGGDSCAFAIYDPNEGTVNISGGTFAGDYDVAAVTAYGLPANADINISGGTYAFDPSAYLADDCIVTDNGNGTYTVKPPYSVNGDIITVNAPSAFSNAVEFAKTSGKAMTINLPAGEYEMLDIYQNWGACTISLVGAVNADGTPATVINVDGNKNWGLEGTVKNITFKDEKNSHIVKFMDGNGLHANIVVDNCVFDGASMQFTGVATIMNSVFDGNGAAWSGIQYSAPGGDIVIDSCTFSGYTFTNLQVTDEGAHKDLTVTVKNCTIGVMSDDAVDYAEGVTLYVDNIVLENNTIDCNVWTPTFANVTKTNNFTSANGDVSYKNW